MVHEDGIGMLEKTRLLLLMENPDVHLAERGEDGQLPAARSRPRETGR